MKKGSIVLVGVFVLVSASFNIMQAMQVTHNQLAPASTSYIVPQNNIMQPVLDDLVWYQPKPSEARILGWEDDWMSEFKRKNYNPKKRLGLHQTEDTPYKEYDLLCDFPAYIPARMPLPPRSQKITRVIFLSWKTRKLGRTIFTSILTILNHNPEYELIMFDDTDVDRFVCDVYTYMAPYFGKLKAGAARVDVWRMMIIYRYGGVYLDIDMSSLAHLPIPPSASGFSGVGGWTHLPESSSSSGSLEHWALAFEPRHNLIETTLKLLLENLKDPENPFVVGKEYVEAEASKTMRLTGPAVYQRALHILLHKAQCRTDNDGDAGNTFAPAILNPTKWCNQTAFRREFGNLVVGSSVDLDGTITPKLFDCASEKEMYWTWAYDNPAFKILEGRHDTFCSELDSRAVKAEKEWREAVRKKKRERGEEEGDDGDDGEEEDDDDEEDEEEEEEEDQAQDMRKMQQRM